jgi:heme exporter protein C
MSAPRTVSRVSLGWLAGIAITGATLFALIAVPADAAQGDVQRIMYIHVPSAWLAYLAFFVTLVGGVLFLLRGDLRCDRAAAASAEIGLLLTGLTIASGAIWGKATWGKWWDWDPRLTTTAILFVIYAGYLLVRHSIVGRRRRARLAAVFGIVGFVNVPIVHFSVLWWRGLHQPPTVLRPGQPTIEPVLLAALLASVVAFTLLYVWLLRERIELESLRDRAELAIGFDR